MYSLLFLIYSWKHDNNVSLSYSSSEKQLKEKTLYQLTSKKYIHVQKISLLAIVAELCDRVRRYLEPLSKPSDLLQAIQKISRI